MKVKAAHYFFTSEQEQNQMFHICSCSLLYYHEKAKGVFQCSTAHCFRIEMETSVKTACLCQMSPWWGHNTRADSHLTNHTLAFSAIPGERRGNKHSRSTPLRCPLGQMFLHHYYRFHDKGMCGNAVSERKFKTQAERTSLHNIVPVFMYFLVLSLQFCYCNFCRSMCFFCSLE